MHRANKKEQMETKQACNWYLPMMSYLETLKMTKFFPNTQNLIQNLNIFYINLLNKRIAK